ncbi:vitamin B6 photo-protection and homoeostasis-domain-containing protein [Colletotrichum lupini]|nr:vitamin B6 photo-protection and homoeostasis-domain-containing protein [Colletotrichum lupini]
MSTRSTQTVLETPTMLRKRSGFLVLAEYDKAGALKTKYVESAPTAGSSRVDLTLPPKRKKPWQELLEIFLPDGYPHSVTDDYAEYQIYDSLQAFAGTIAGMISSRAVWQGLGVGDSLASPTGAMLIQVTRESMGRLATITFAHLFATSIEAECKAYRMACDLLTDTAMILDCASPYFPQEARFLVLCLSSILYSASGVVGNASKSSLSGHFAKWNNLGELNAKDASQETAISLIGMLTGTFLLYFLTDETLSWIVLFVLLGVHLFLNWRGVRAVHSRQLNRQRTNIALSALFSKDEVLTPLKVSQRELIFEKRRGEVFRWNSGPVFGHCKYGVPLKTLLEALAYGKTHEMSFQLSSVDLYTLMDVFDREEYVLWCQVSTAANDAASRIKVIVVLKEGVTPRSQLKAWFHGLLLARKLSGQEEANLVRAEFDQQAMLGHVKESLQIANEKYELYARRLASAGWNIEVPVLETRAGSRIVREPDEMRSH